MSGKAYSMLSAVYDRLTDKALYEKWKDRSLAVLSSYPNLRSGIDAACGSGFFTIAQKKAGYKVTGVDVSREMLFVAQANAIKAGADITFIEQDISALKVFDKVDYITVVNDGVNYIPSDKLKKAFVDFFKALNVGGVLYFDFSTEFRLKNVIGNNVFAEDYEDLTFLWFNEFKGDRVGMDMTVFRKNGEVYDRYDESHVQYVHSLETIKSLLSEAGFKNVRACAFLGGDVNETTERIEIIAEKRAKNG